MYGIRMGLGLGFRRVREPQRPGEGDNKLTKKLKEPPIIHQMTIWVRNGKVKSNRHPRSMEEYKEKVQACLIYHDYVTGKSIRSWLVKLHGFVINKVIDAWIREAQKTLKESVNV